ncbi:MAG: thiamine diphosphokinase, partial [Clostridiales bacterium]|nr:thiamine diphosphokinase [Clostridiales bacterium]
MRRCLIITGGKLDMSFAGLFLEHERFERVIAVDAGLEAV